MMLHKQVLAHPFLAKVEPGRAAITGLSGGALPSKAVTVVGEADNLIIIGGGHGHPRHITASRRAKVGQLRSFGVGSVGA